MANLRAKYLYPKEIGSIVTPLLAEAFEPYGYRDSSIKEDETFAGDPIIRIKVEVDTAVPAKKLAQARSDIHDALRAKDEERVVFLSAPGPDKPLTGSEEDEDFG